MTFTKDSALAYKVVPAAPTEQGLRGGGLADVKSITIHMAEGGGTVSWLTRPDGNCSHYVVEYDGRIVQMVPERNWAGSINPNLVRKTDDPPYVFLGETVRYGRTAVVAGVGLTAAGNPNRYTVAIEVEGFAGTGPNAKQRAGLKALVADIRHRRAKPLPCFGHRDWQSYKACPGHRIAWIDYGGHAKRASAPISTPEVPTTMAAIKGSTTPEVPTLVYLKPAGPSVAWLYVWSDHRADVGNKQLNPNRPLLLTRFIDGDTYAVAYEPTGDDANDTSLELFVKTVDIVKTAPVTFEPEQSVIDAAVAAKTAALVAEKAALAARLATANSRMHDAAVDLGATAPTPV